MFWCNTYPYCWSAYLPLVCHCDEPFYLSKDKRIKRVEKYLDEATKLTKERTVYDKVVYYEYTMENRVSLSVAYSIKRTDRDELPISDVFNQEKRDRVNYAEFKGDYKLLVPGTWKYLGKDSDADKVYDSASSIQSLRVLFEGKKTIQSITELENALTDECAAQITEQVKKYQPEN